MESRKKIYTIILLGDIAAGKGTQAEILVKKFPLKLISTGAYSRKVLTGQTKVSRRLTRTRLGKLAPSDIIQRYLKFQISELKTCEGVLIDGGKMPAEAKLIYKIFTKQGRKILVIYLRIPRAEIYKRLSLRYYCEKTGKPLTLVKKTDKCPHCGGRVIKRADDELHAIKNRIDYYEKIYSKTVKFWQGLGLLRFVNGKQSVNKVTENIVQIVDNYYGDRRWR